MRLRAGARHGQRRAGGEPPGRDLWRRGAGCLGFGLCHRRFRHRRPRDAGALHVRRRQPLSGRALRRRPGGQDRGAGARAGPVLAGASRRAAGGAGDRQPARIPRARRSIEIPVDPALLEAGDHNGSTFYQHVRFAAAVRGQGPVEVTLDGRRAGGRDGPRGASFGAGRSCGPALGLPARMSPADVTESPLSGGWHGGRGAQARTEASPKGSRPMSRHEDLDAVLQPIEHARGLPNRHYIDPETFAARATAAFLRRLGRSGFRLGRARARAMRGRWISSACRLS